MPGLGQGGLDVAVGQAPHPTRDHQRFQGVGAGHAGTEPIDGTQYQEWNAAVKTVEMIERINQPHLDHGLERGLGIEL
jgi:hypothetical protein